MKKYQIIIWLAALAVGVGIGLLHVGAVDTVMNFIATVFTRLFRLLAVPTIALAVITTLASLGGGKEMGRMFRTTITYTLMTTFAAALVGLLLYVVIAPGNLPVDVIKGETAGTGDKVDFSYTDHLLTVIPDNIVKPFLEGNVLAILLLCFAVGIALSKMPESEPKRVVMTGLAGLQELLFKLIHWLIVILPIGIVAFAAQLTAQVGSGVMLESLGRYVLVVIGGNCVQFFVVLPLFLLVKGINPIKTLKGMTRQY